MENSFVLNGYNNEYETFWGKILFGRLIDPSASHTDDRKMNNIMYQCNLQDNNIK